MAVRDDLSGLKFEDEIKDAFRNIGYENVQQDEQTAGKS